LWCREPGKGSAGWRRCLRQGGDLRVWTA
jgi:hypothetical protein